MKTVTTTQKRVFVQRHYRENNSGSVSRDSLDQVTTWVQSVIKDERSRDYRSIIARGMNATTDMTGIGRIKIESVQGYAELEAVYKPANFSNGYFARTSGDLLPVDASRVGGFNASASSLTTARNQALTKLYSELAGLESTFKGMVFAGELRETLGMIRRPAEALRRGVSTYLNDIPRRIPRNASNAYKQRALAGTWLEYAYGWKPLVSDLDSAVDHFFKSRLPRPIFKMVRGVGRSGIVENSGVTGTSVGLSVTANIQRVDEYIVKYYGIYQSKGNGCDNRHRYGWNPTEFVPTLWELIPYSFLIDYFTNVGDIISSWSYRFIGLNWCSLTEIQQVEAIAINPRINEFVDTNDWDYKYRSSLGSARATKQSFTRVPSVLLGVPSLEFSVPGLSSTKWLNMAALASQLNTARRHVSD